MSGHWCKKGDFVEDEDCWPVYDARGIYLTKVCDKCEKEKLSKYRKEVLDNPSYEADEPID